MKRTFISLPPPKYVFGMLWQRLIEFSEKSTFGNLRIRRDHIGWGVDFDDVL